jgi:hypothetical protein
VVPNENSSEDDICIQKANREEENEGFEVLFYKE